MKKIVIQVLLSSVILILLTGVGEGVPATDESHTLEQPYGDEFEAKQWGTEMKHGWETTDGYSILRNGSGYWVYADEQDGSLVPTRKVVGVDAPKGLEKHLRPDTSNTSNVPTLDDGGSDGSDALQSDTLTPQSLTIQPTQNIPVILVNYSNTATKYTKNDFETLLFGDDPSLATGPGSLSDYYDEASYGKLNVTGDVSGWVTANREKDFYSSDGDSYFEIVGNASRLAGEAAKKVDDRVNFSKYDDDGDGKVQIVVVHQGPGQESTGNPEDIWSHLGFLSYQTDDSVEIDGYTMQPETQNGSLITVGVFAHEIGHIFGLPDLYNTSYGGGLNFPSEIDRWGLMGKGSLNQVNRTGDSPAHLSAWSKKELGIINTTKVKRGNGLEDETLKPVSRNRDYYQLMDPSENPNQEYFLVANRQRTGFDKGLLGTGLIIYHVDDDRCTSNCGSENDELLQIEASDGNWNGSSSPSDLWNTGNFGVDTTPNSSFHNGNKSHSYVRLISPSENDTEYKADLSVGEVNNFPPEPDFTYAPDPSSAGDSIKFDASSSIDTDGTIQEYRWDFGDGETATGENVSYSYSSPGSYDVTLSVTDNAGAKDNTTVSVKVSLFTEPLPLPNFESPPQNTGELDPNLYEDLSGDGDGVSVAQTVSVFGELVRSDGLGLTPQQASKLNWNGESSSENVTAADMVSLFGEQIRAD